MECWIRDCAFPRAKGSDYCAVKHGGDAAPVAVVSAAPRRVGVRPQPASEEVFALLVADGPLTLGELSNRRGVTVDTTHRTVGRMIRAGRVVRVGLASYAAVRP
jgi:hypothetical protein